MGLFILQLFLEKVFVIAAFSAVVIVWNKVPAKIKRNLGEFVAN